MTKYYVDAQGMYLGGFDGANPPANSTEVASPPVDGRQKWDGNAWLPIDPTLDPAADVAFLNATLSQQGSIVRALGLVMFAEINKLRVKGGDPAYTLAQFKAALVAQMRT